ncbi:alpha-galactosidase [Sphingobacterium sp. KB22]|uniref:Alpha-galactosidase n=2 Tax=Sphingobacterium hungaricum TaxID=2082723 RepID=A0A928YNR3_9SPHI|nr:alpha-galactosidase [Sphingobacterium hungaricum]
MGQQIVVNQLIVLESKTNALVIQEDNGKNLTLAYFGKKLSNQKEYELIRNGYKLSRDYSSLSNSIYTPSGSRNILEPAITAIHADGNASLVLSYVNHKTEQIDKNVSLLSITLRDTIYDFTVNLYYKCFYEEDVIVQWSSIEHNEKGNVQLQKFASANLVLKAPSYYLYHHHGDWNREMQSEETKLTHGIFTLDSKLGTRANQLIASSFMISLKEPSTEDSGEVLFGALAYTGNFKMEFELDYINNLRIIAGINNFASTYTLKPKEIFTTPQLVYTLSNEGKGKASRNLHDWMRKYQLLDGEGERLTLLNNWEATHFDFDETILKDLIKDTKKLGVELFLLDDGWFGNKYPRVNANAGLGDWEPNRTRLPNGIASLVEEAKANGVKFGIWIEPEMVNPKSELYENHPDWVIKQPQRAPHYSRNQLVLDLSNPKVQDYVFKVVDDLFTQNPELAHIKWDCNSLISNAYSSYLNNQQHFYIEYVRGLNNVFRRIREKYPKVPIMLCSGGGGRVDYSAMRYFTEFWPSDNTDPLERIFMQYEYSYFYPSMTISSHVTDMGKQPIKYRTDVAMMGKLGFDIVVASLNETDLMFCQNAVKLYDGLRDVIWHGDLYRLADPKVENFSSILYLDKNRKEGVLFNYLVNNRYQEGSQFPVRLKDLNPAKNYKVEEVNLYPETKSTFDSSKNYSGEYLMSVGINPDVSSRRMSVILKINEL